MANEINPMFIFAVRREGALEGLALLLHFPLTGSQAGWHNDPKKRCIFRVLILVHYYCAVSSPNSSVPNTSLIRLMA